MASCGAAAEHLGCLPGKPSCSLERWPGWDGQVGWLVGLRWRQVGFPPYFLFLFLFNISATLLNLIKYLGNFKNHQTIPGP